MSNEESPWIHGRVAAEVRRVLSAAQQVLINARARRSPDPVLAQGELTAAWDDGWSYAWLVVERIADDRDSVRLVYNVLHCWRRHCTELKAALPSYAELPAADRSLRTLVEGMPETKIAEEIAGLCERFAGTGISLEADGAMSFRVPLNSVTAHDPSRSAVR